MAGLNTHYVPMGTNEIVFVDKDSGKPLSGGTVTFYKDNSRIDLKSVFILGGIPPNYTYTEIGNTLVLGAAGKPVDEDKNDIIPYFYPYDISGNLELYYYTVYNSENVFQYDREGQPNLAQGGSDTVSTTNYISNGQFLIHQDLPETNTYDAGEVRSSITILDNDGWTYERTTGTTAIDYIFFDTFGGIVTVPSANPKYFCNILCEDPGTGGFKSLRYKFPDVNKFASNSQGYTFSFSAKTNVGTGQPLNINLIKFYGTGGSTATSVNLGSVILSTSYDNYNIHFTFGTNDGKTITSDSYVQIDVSLPSYTFDVNFTDMALVVGTVTLTTYPATPEYQMRYETLPPAIPDYSNMDLYLPVILTPTGLQYDHSTIGTSILLNSRIVPKGYLLEDGSQYETSEISSDGIPYSRLQKADVIWDSAHRLPKWGTGKEFVSVLNGSGGPNTLPILFQANTFGTTTSISDGTPATGFTFLNLSSGVVNGHGFYSYPIGTATFIVSTFAYGLTSGANAGNSGFTVNVVTSGDNESPPMYQYTAIVATGLAGKYFVIYTQTTQFYVWYKVSGVGTDPAPGGTGILVDVLTADLAQDVMLKTLNVINGVYSCDITTVAASAILAGSYFNFYTPQPYNQHCVVWYTKDGVGVEPIVSGAKLIKVALISGDTAVQVGEKTLVAINSVYYCVPDKRGQFLRFWDDQAGFDPDAQNGIIQMSVNAAGTGYVVGDIVTVVQAGASGGSIRVTTINGGGGITGFIRDGVGTSGGYGINYNNGAATASGGSGSSATFTITQVGQTRAPAAYDNGISFIYGDNPGSRQYAQLFAHNHSYSDLRVGPGSPGTFDAGGSGNENSHVTTTTGEKENRTINIYVVSAIKY